LLPWFLEDSKMYSVVLMMALTTGTDAVDFGHRNRCSGGYGCHGGGGYGCYGGGGYGCSGGCYGGGGYGCSGGCYGGYGGCYGGYGRYGCSGGYGGCSGGYAGYGCSGGYGGCSGGYAGYGCSGGYGCCGGGAVYGGGMMVAPVQPEQVPVTPKKATGKEEVRGPTPATILVTLPASAKLSIDGSATTSTSSTRRFVSPPLELGSTYVYTLRAEINGQTQSQEVRVRPGEITRTQFTFPTAAVAGR
jgi:uncharacterized protein (TIGR03000 family)